MRSHTAARIVLLAAVCLGAASTAPLAQERTSAIIQDLVEEMAAELASYGSRSDGWAAEADRLQRAEEQTYQAFKGTTDPVERAELRAQYLKRLADINRLDREQADVTISTLDQVLPTILELKGLVGHLDHRNALAGSIGRTASVQRFVENTYITIGRLKHRLQDGEHEYALTILEKQLATQDALFDAELGPERSMRNIDDTFRWLESVYVTLLQVRDVLSSERTQLRAGAIASVVDTATARLESLFDASDVHELGGAIRERVGERLRRYREIHEADRPSRPRRSLSPADEQRLRRIRERYRHRRQ